MILVLFKILFSVVIGVSWLFFSGKGSEEIALILTIFTLIILFVKPTKFRKIQDDEEYKQRVLNRQLRKVKLEEERIIEKKQAQKDKGDKI